MPTLTLTPEQIELACALTAVQRRMVISLAAGDHDTPEKAFVAAGGDPGQNAALSARDAMELPRVAAFYDSLKTSVSRSKIMTRDEALARLSTIARATIKDVANFSKRCLGESMSGQEVWQSVWELKGSHEMSDHAAALISELTTTKDGFRFKTHNQLDAIKMLASIEGWVTQFQADDKETDGMSKLERAARIAEILDSGRAGRD